MDEKTQNLVDNFLQSCNSIDIFGYTLGVFIAHKNHNESNFNSDFNRFNQVNGIRFEYVNLPNNQIAISER
jgi:hypothetical protein